MFDTTYTNVALMKSTTSSLQNSKTTSAMAVNGIIDFDNVTSGDMTFDALCNGQGWWQVDLGGIYNLTTIMLWNRYPWTSPVVSMRATDAPATLQHQKVLCYHYTQSYTQWARRRREQQSGGVLLGRCSTTSTSTEMSLVTGHYQATR